MSVTETDPLRSQACDEARVVEALEAYIAEVERGRAPDRSTFLREHAEVAGELEACLDGLALVNSIASRLRPTSTPGEGTGRRGLDVGPATCLGDFRIVREVGRGGMGIVYEAEQVSLGRRVALKVLPFTAALDPRQLQRFKVEAQAAAQLHHTNIVPVFAVGSDRGVHYYAMQFIDGYTLADIIGELREIKTTRDKPSLIRTSVPGEPQEDTPSGHGTTIASGTRNASRGASGEPTASSGSTLGIASRGRAYYRMVARLGVQASRALEHAHALGVLHRDVKPANLMVDVRGNLWITDFGLARFQDEAGLTLTGDLLGTLRYMSPEQARGKPALVDHRSDIYSLGTTIYELLTFRPAFEGRDRAELLRSIAEVEPIAPRKLDPGIPRELETIVMKAMAKEPHERYATAQDFGDDLQRFLDDKPIQARRPSPLDLAAKWARRHRSIVATAAVLLLLLVCALSVGTVMIAHERDIAEAQKRETIEKFQFTREVLDDLYRMIVDREPALDPGVSELQREFLERVLVYYNQIAAEISDDPVVRRDSALAYRQVGDIEYRLGKPDRSEQAYRYGLELLNGLADDPDAKELGIPQETASLCKCLGRLLQATIRDGEAEALFRRAITVQSDALEGQERLDGRAPTQLAHSHLELGVLLEMQGRTDEAVAEYNRALELTLSVLGASGKSNSDPEEVDHLNTLALRATIQSHLNFVRSDYKAAAAENVQAIDYYRTLRANHPSSSESRAKLAHAYFRHAWMIGDLRFAEIYDPEEAMRLSREAVEIDPQNAAYHHKRGVMLMQTGDARQAREEFEHVLKLVPDSPDAHNTLAWLMATTTDPAIRNPARAVELAKQAVKETHEVGIYWNTLGVALYQAGEYREAIVALTRAAELRNQGDSYDWFFLAMAHWRLGRRSEAIRWYHRAVEWMDLNRRYNSELKHFREMAEALLGSPSPRAPVITESADSGASPPNEDLSPTRRNPETSRRAEDPRTPGGSPYLISATVSPGGNVPAASRGAESRASSQQGLRVRDPAFRQPSRVLRIVPIPVAFPEAGLRPSPRE